MNQIKFLWLSKNIPGILGVEQLPDGVAVTKLRNKIDIIHNSGKRNRIDIVFHDDGTSYVISDQKTLEEIYRMHMENEEIMLLLHQYCEKNLARS